MGRKNFIKGSDKSDRTVIKVDQDSFAAGLIKDFPATEIPNNAVAEADNVVVFPNEVQGRLGSELYTATEVPPLTGKTGLTASKAGYIITRTDNAFTEEDVGNYWVWPDADPVHEEITRYISGFSVEVATSDTRVATPGCYMRGKENLWVFHSTMRVWLAMYGNEFWIADIAMAAWTKVVILSAATPFNSKSESAEFDEDSWIVFNSAGHFHINYYMGMWAAWARNTPIPNISIPEVPATGSTFYRYGYIYSSARLSEMGNFIDRLSPSRIEVESGTNSWGTNLQDYNDVSTASPISALNGQVVGPLYVPIVNNTDPVEYQQHLTHFPIYRTLDKDNKYQQGDIESRLNDPERYVWVKDLRICGAFFARKYGGHVLVQYGQFEEADIGSVIEWEDGSRDTITGYVAPDDVIIDHAPYFGVESDYMACCIGNGRVFRATQTGTVVTRTHGDIFTTADVGKTLTSSTGYRSVILTYVDPNTVTVHDDQDKVAQGFTTDATHRYYYDLIDDATLNSRTRDLVCAVRFLEPMPNVNDGIVVPGFMITAIRNEKKIYYCAWADSYEYTASFYYKGYQFSTKIKNNIQKLLSCPNRFAVLCQDNKTWYGPINASETTTLPEVNAVIPILGGIDVLDSAIGCFDFGSIQNVENGAYVMLTAEASGVGMRSFDGYQYGPNLLEVGKIGHTTLMRDLDQLQKATASLYDAIMGYVVWGRHK